MKLKQHQEKMFKTGTDKRPKSYNLHVVIIETIDRIAKANGTNASDLVGNILDEYLTSEVRLGNIERPDKASDKKPSSEGSN